MDACQTFSSAGTATVKWMVGVGQRYRDMDKRGQRELEVVGINGEYVKARCVNRTVRIRIDRLTNPKLYKLLT